jgi:hypothetical protein
LDTQPRAGSQPGESSATQGESQSASSSVIMASSGAAVLVSSSSASTSGRATEESTAVSSTSDVVSRSTGVSTVVSLPCFGAGRDNDVGLDFTSGGIDKCCRHCCCCGTWWSGLWVRDIRGHLCCGTVWYVSCLQDAKRHNRKGVSQLHKAASCALWSRLSATQVPIYYSYNHKSSHALRARNSVSCAHPSRDP